jgi:hypothetical protein
MVDVRLVTNFLTILTSILTSISILGILTSIVLILKNRPNRHLWSLPTGPRCPKPCYYPRQWLTTHPRGLDGHKDNASPF